MNEQLRLPIEENTGAEENGIEKVNACVFTGHRELGADFSVRRLRAALEEVIKSGVTDFYNGMAKGFDLEAASAVVRMKKKYPFIRLIACVPCYGQEKYFSEKDKKRYISLLKKADEKMILSQSYYNGCMQVRDRYMAERASVMIAYCKKEEGGAAYTVKIFKKLHPQASIFFL